MDKFDRFQIVHRLFSGRTRPVPLSDLIDRLECSSKTVHRTFEQMRDFLDAPIEYCPQGKGWHYAREPGDLFELPGLWLTSQELQSLALLLNLLENLGNGLLNQELSVMEKEIHKLLKARDIQPNEFSHRIKVLPMAARTVADNVFADIGETLLHRKQLAIRYRDYSQRQTWRTVSPQTLVHYRDNWYLDAWCHKRMALRTFSLARIASLRKLNDPAKDISKERLKEHFEGSFGIFSGEANKVARIRFFPPSAYDVSTQVWHPHQTGEWQGSDYLLSIPYGDERELVGDLLRYIPDIIVEEPVTLRDVVRKRLKEGLKVHQ